MARIAKLSGFVVLVTVINLVTILAVVGPTRSTAGQDPPCYATVQAAVTGPVGAEVPS